MNTRIKLIIKLIIQLAFLLFVLGFIAIRPFRLIVVNGSSMMPTYRSHQAVFAVRYFHLERGDVVIIKDPDTDEKLIKRVVAMSGDHYWQYTWRNSDGNNQQMYWFGPEAERQARVFVERNKSDAGRLTHYTLSPNSVFVLGDNLRNSIDSRDFGPMPIRSILYKVI